ncbi:unnamed protein product [Blepharisma stoltei]|uniref:Uncharacterized protein n=1 Tax=Blepharisma stoltei TaxID=1481888 RepID=A0AAU9K482_9CILI|nr:unnamed protein product [Blepharisma stoltei]
MKKTSRITLSEAVYNASKHVSLGFARDLAWISSPVKDDFDPKFFHKSLKHLRIRDRNYDLVHQQPKSHRTHIRTKTYIHIKQLSLNEKPSSSKSTSPSLSPKKSMRTNSNAFVEQSPNISPETSIRSITRRSTILSPILPKTEDEELDTIISGASKLHSQTRSLKRHFSMGCVNIQKDYQECKNLVRSKNPYDKKFEKLVLEP